MLTPQEVSEHAFAKASFGGYNMAMVDEFLDALTTDYTTLYKENVTLKAKMKVLVEKVEDYRSTEDAMRKTLLTAQKMADDMVAEAERQKTAMLASAEEDARARKAELRHELDEEQVRLTSAQNATAAYVARLKDICQHELEYLGHLSEMTAAPTRPADPVIAAARDIEATMDRMREADERPVTMPETGREGGLYAELLELGRNSPAQEVDSGALDDTQPTLRISLDSLQFGKDYTIE